MCKKLSVQCSAITITAKDTVPDKLDGELYAQWSINNCTTFISVTTLALRL